MNMGSTTKLVLHDHFQNFAWENHCLKSWLLQRAVWQSQPADEPKAKSQEAVQGKDNQGQNYDRSNEEETSFG